MLITVSCVTFLMAVLQENKMFIYAMNGNVASLLS